MTTPELRLLRLLATRPAVYVAEGRCASRYAPADAVECVLLNCLEQMGMVKRREEKFYSEPYLYCGRGVVYRITEQGLRVLRESSNVGYPTLATH